MALLFPPFVLPVQHPLLTQPRSPQPYPATPGIAAARRRGVVFGRRPRQGRGVKLFYQRLTQSLDGDGCAKLAAISLIILRL